MSAGSVYEVGGVPYCALRNQLLSRGTFIHNKVLAKAQFELFYLHYMQRKRII